MPRPDRVSGKSGGRHIKPPSALSARRLSSATVTSESTPIPTMMRREPIVSSDQISLFVPPRQAQPDAPAQKHLGGFAVELTSDITAPILITQRKTGRQAKRL